MKTLSPCFAALCLFVGIAPVCQSASDASGPSLTLYNQEFGVVREQVNLSLKKGLNNINFSEVTAHLEPSSVILRDPSGKSGVRILEQNYRNDAVSADLLLQYFTGQEIDFETVLDGKKQTVRGKIVRAPYVMHQEAMTRMGRQYAATQSVLSNQGNSPIIEVDGKLQFNLPGNPIFPALADDSILQPTLEWKLDAAGEINSPLELSYVSGGFDWEADYNLVFPEKGDKVSATGWITMQNQSGRTFVNATIRLMAGDVKKIQQAQPMARRDVLAMSAPSQSEPQVTEKAFDEYHLYSLARPTTLRDRETKQVEFLRAEEIKARTVYIYNGLDVDWNRYRGWDADNFRNDRAFGTQSNKKVWVYREFKNSKENGLGVPLPKGRVRFYRQDTGDRLEFIGEGEIDHTPRDEELKIYTGDAFDLVGERKRTNFTIDNSRRTLDEAFEITLRNRKEEAVEIKVAETLYRGATWSIVDASDEWKKVDSQAMEFLVKLEPDQEKVIKYHVRYTW